ncbi:DNA replication and repair protein RecR [Desulfonatronum thiosulfatophilum]|uniref:Recombination protein RecR n=1 Tax=Desulfonatronum thiosulfatophilum TaxID=617002 RepID=A0A1G6C1X3_9BACT|nr:recombination mediator RecR [Desulfonatronum thiosulfatophilum]SDB26847.1 DNA replication and repair protein RecR [Desulfonatronum thiosulfatophilum]
MRELPQTLRVVVDQLATLPGLGPKSALRVALTLLKWPKERTMDLGRGILELRDKLCLCSSCAGISDQDPCAICTDPERRPEQLCLVAEWDSMLIMEQSGIYKGMYLVLGGLLSPLDGIKPESLEMVRLREKLSRDQVTELILALGTTMESETTGSYIKNLVEREFPLTQVTRLAQGIPLGTDLKYIDKETLRQSIAYRQKI